MSRGLVTRWALDIGLASGLLVALAVVAAVEPSSTPPSLPDSLSVAVVPRSSEIEIPPLPPLSITFDDLRPDKEVPPPPLPPQPPQLPEEIPSPPQPFEDKVDQTRLLGIGFSGLRTYGLVRIGKSLEDDKKLTFDQFGRTNHTAVMVDNLVLPFFHPNHGRVVKNLDSDGKTDAISSDKLKGDNKKEVDKLATDGPYVVQWESGGVLFEQRVEYEAGLVSRKIDTLRIRYTLTNIDTRPHKAGMRLMIDTYIGSNDGVPFFIPGQKKVIDKPIEIPKKDVPDHILALERNDLGDPTMTVVQIGLAPPQGSAAERPDAVAITQWPGDRLAAARDPEYPFAAVEWLDKRWQWPLAKSFNRDSAIVLAYLPATIAPNKQRVFEYTYGLGSLSGQNPELNLAAYGPFVPGKPFRVSAFVKNPKPGQTVTLDLPKGLSLDKDDPPVKPVEIQAGVTITKVDWLVTPSDEFGGKAKLTATLSGAAKPETYTIVVHNPRPALQPVVVSGTPAPEAVVRVTAAVFNSKVGTTTTLELPAGVTFEPGSVALQPVPPGSVVQASWLVRLPTAAVGDLPVTVRMANPTATVAGVIRVPPTVPKLATLRVDGTPQAGGVLRITAQVANPAAGGTVDLKLPPGFALSPSDQKESQPTPTGRVAPVSWIVRVAPGRVGPATVVVRLSPQGQEESKTVEVAPATPHLIARPATDAPATPGRPFWIVARVFHPPERLKATLTLPPGVSLAGGKPPEVVMEGKTAEGVPYAEAAWPVTLDEFVRQAVEFKVTVPGVGTQPIEVKCERGSVIR
jgi:hypothetical protein